MNGTSTLLIDKSRLFREGLGRILSGSPFCVDYQASTPDEALAMLGSVRPGLVLFGVQDVGDDPSERIGEIRAALPEARIVMLADRVRVDRLSDALSAGVDGYLLKDMSADALLQSLRLVLLGEKVFPTTLAHVLTNRRMVRRDGEQARDDFAGLSHRETQILACLLNGASNKQIANELDIAEGTVKVHLKAVLKKINARNRTQAAIWALNNGIGADVFSARWGRLNGAVGSFADVGSMSAPSGPHVSS